MDRLPEALCFAFGADGFHLTLIVGFQLGGKAVSHQVLAFQLIPVLIAGDDVIVGEQGDQRVRESQAGRIL